TTGTAKNRRNLRSYLSIGVSEMIGVGGEAPEAKSIGSCKFWTVARITPRIQMMSPCQVTTGHDARSSAETRIRLRISFTFFGPRECRSSTRSPGFHARTRALEIGMVAFGEDASPGQLAVNRT